MAEGLASETWIGFGAPSGPESISIRQEANQKPRSGTFYRYGNLKYIEAFTFSRHFQITVPRWPGAVQHYGHVLKLHHGHQYPAHSGNPFPDAQPQTPAPWYPPAKSTLHHPITLPPLLPHRSNLSTQSSALDDAKPVSQPAGTSLTRPSNLDSLNPL